MEKTHSSYKHNWCIPDIYFNLFKCSGKFILLRVFHCSAYFSIFLDQNFRDGKSLKIEDRLKCHTCSILASFYSKICSNSFVKIMFNEYKYVLFIKKVFGLSFLLSEGQDFLLEIHNHSRHTFSQYSKEDKRC